MRAQLSAYMEPVDHHWYSISVQQTRPNKGTTQVTKDHVLDNTVLCIKSNYCLAQVRGTGMWWEFRTQEQKIKQMGKRQVKKVRQGSGSRLYPGMKVQLSNFFFFTTYEILLGAATCKIELLWLKLHGGEWGATSKPPSPLPPQHLWWPELLQRSLWKKIQGFGTDIRLLI